MALSTEFQVQLDRLAAYVKVLEAGPDGQATEDTSALSAALDATGAPAVVAPTVATEETVSPN